MPPVQLAAVVAVLDAIAPIRLSRRRPPRTWLLDPALRVHAANSSAGGEVVGASAIGICRESVVGSLAAMFLRVRAVAVGGIFVSLGGAIVSPRRASKRGLFPLLRCPERGLRILLPGVGVAGAPVGGEVCSPSAEVVHALGGEMRSLRSEARGLRGDCARIVRGVHPTTIPPSSARFPQPGVPL